MVREIDVSEITLRLREKSDDKGDKKDENILAKIKGNTLDGLKSALVSTTELHYQVWRLINLSTKHTNWK